MNLRQKIKENLKKITNHKYDYGCVFLNLDYDRDFWIHIQSKIEDEDIYTKEGDDGYGREMQPHVTILYGIHSDVSDKKVEKYIHKILNPQFKLSGISFFENTEFDVIKFDVESKDLHDLNKLFKELPHTSTFPNYHPHVTICYLKKGLLDKYKKIFKDIDLPKVEADSVTYSKVDSTEKKYNI
jgi:2'-5' RNA ligase